MRDLVHHRVADDLGLAAWRRGHPLDRRAVDGDAVRHVRLAEGALRERHSFVEPQELHAVVDPAGLGLVVDDDLDVPHPLTELSGQIHERAPHQSGESCAVQV